MRKMKTVKLSPLKLRSTHLIHARDPIAYGTLLKFKPQHLLLREPLKWRVLHTPVVAVDMAVTNPTRERIVMVMDVLIEGVALSVSPRSFCIQGNKLHIT